MSGSILLPAVVLVIWTILMLFWMALTRLPALSKAGIDLTSSVGGRGAEVDVQVPPQVAWKSHNYTHLLEQPTLFYATVIMLAVIGANTELNLGLAWGYVGLRIAHSLWQAMINSIPVRFGLFLLSTFCLLGLAINALRALI